MARYVILEHDWPEQHYDLMLEVNHTLKTWRIARLFDAAEQEALQLPDHRLEYLNYEGPVSGNRGTVKRVQQGTCLISKRDEAEWNVELTGSAVRQIRLLQIDGLNWKLLVDAA